MSFSHLSQGTALLSIRRQQQQKIIRANNIQEGFQNNPAAYSACSAQSGNPRYGWCPPSEVDLLYEKDDDPGQRAAQMSTFNQLLSQYGSMYQNYMENVTQYVANPPKGLYGRNVYVPQLGGPAAPGFPSPAPPPSAPITNVMYNGNKYSTISGVSPDSTNAQGCDTTPTAIPSGWKVAPDNADSKYIISHHDWGHDVMVVSTGNAYGTPNWCCGSAGELWNSNMLSTAADGKVFVNSCSVGILLIAPGSGSSGGAAPPTPSVPGFCTSGPEWAAKTSQSGCKWSPVPNSDPQSCVYQQKSWCQGQCEGIWCGPGVKDAGCGAGGWCQKVGSRKP